MLHIYWVIIMFFVVVFFAAYSASLHFFLLVSYLFAFIAFFLTLNIFDHFFLFVRVAYFDFYGQKLYAHAKTLPGTLLQ